MIKQLLLYKLKMVHVSYKVVLHAIAFVISFELVFPAVVYNREIRKASMKFNDISNNNQVWYANQHHIQQEDHSAKRSYATYSGAIQLFRSERDAESKSTSKDNFSRLFRRDGELSAPPIAIADAQRSDMVGKESSLWPGGVVPIDMHKLIVGNDQKKLFLRVVEYIQKYSCIRFRNATKDEHHVLITTSQDGCYANVGRVASFKPESQKLNLQETGCWNFGTILHELMHTLGFFHEQSRNDRDNYVEIHWENIKEDDRDQFRTGNERNLVVQESTGFYDYGSIMHYPGNAFAIDENLPTITAIQNPDVNNAKMGLSRKGVEYMSDEDIRQLNSRYKCAEFGQQTTRSSSTVSPSTIAMGTKCKTSIDCLGGWLCRGERCVQPCESYSNCPGSKICRLGTCLDVCKTHTDCPGMQNCRELNGKICMDDNFSECQSILDCVGFLPCNNGVCETSTTNRARATTTTARTTATTELTTAKKRTTTSKAVHSTSTAFVFCQTSNDCPDDEICREGLCFQSCKYSFDCPGLKNCRFGICFDACTAHKDCFDQDMCRETNGKSCTDDNYSACLSTAECDGFSPCYDGICVTSLKTVTRTIDTETPTTSKRKMLTIWIAAGTSAITAAVLLIICIIGYRRKNQLQKLMPRLFRRFRMPRTSPPKKFRPAGSQGPVNIEVVMNGNKSLTEVSSQPHKTNDNGFASVDMSQTTQKIHDPSTYVSPFIRGIPIVQGQLIIPMKSELGGFESHNSLHSISSNKSPLNKSNVPPIKLVSQQENIETQISSKLNSVTNQPIVSVSKRKARPSRPPPKVPDSESKIHKRDSKRNSATSKALKRLSKPPPPPVKPKGKLLPGSNDSKLTNADEAIYYAVADIAKSTKPNIKPLPAVPNKPSKLFADLKQKASDSGAIIHQPPGSVSNLRAKFEKFDRISAV